MIYFNADIRRAHARSDDSITSGSVGIPVALALDSAFDGLAKTLCFKTATASVDIALVGDTTESTVPPDVISTAGEWLYIGIYAADGDGNIVIPTVWANAGKIEQGTIPSGVDPSEPTPSWVAQVQNIASEALETANSVREDADSGKFDGEPGEAGTNGTTFIPSVDAAGVISWVNDGDLPNPQPRNIRGPKGDKLTYADLTAADKEDLIQGPIAEAQTAAVAAVNRAGASQEQAVEDKGAEVLESIPADYTELSEDVDDLKSALNDLGDRVDILEELEKGRGFTPAQIQAIAASGHADEYFSIGDIINIEWTDKTPATPVTYTVPHVVTHFGDVEDENGVTHKNAMFLMWMYTTPQTLPFDQPEQIVADEETFQSGYYYYTKNDDGSFTEQTVTVGDPIPAGTTYYKHVRTGMAARIRYGSNDWSQSAYRQWLNSTGGKGEWWVAQHDSDVAPSQATSLPGFLTGYSDDWLAIFKPVKVVTALNTVCDGGVDVVTYDKFFLPSLEQMYGSPQKAGVEGDVWEYWIEETGLPSRSNGSNSNTNDARKIPAISNPTGAAVSVRLRSALRSSTSAVWNVYAAGYLNSSHASYAFRAQPACVIY